jgi:hypothetical protein
MMGAHPGSQEEALPAGSVAGEDVVLAASFLAAP